MDWLWRGVIIGFGVGLLLSIFIVFPEDILSMKLVQMTTGDLLRIFGGLVAPFIAAVIGGIIGEYLEFR